jgi:hypothetical protein
VLVDGDDEQAAGRRLRGRLRFGGAGRRRARALRTDVLDQIDREHAPPPAVDGDLEIVRPEPREGVALLVDHLHINRQPLDPRFQSLLRYGDQNRQ